MNSPSSTGVSNPVSYFSEERQKRAEAYKQMGIFTQTVAFVLNFLLWGFSIYLIVYGLIAGLGTKTIRVDDYNILDWILVTPATIFLYYGVPMLVVATWGWFAVVTAHSTILLIYISLLIWFIFYDSTCLISLMAGSDAYNYFLGHIKQSLYHYGERNPPSVFGLHPTTYWDHLQERGLCCGWNDFEDWENHTMAVRNDYSIPDSCCNKFYGYKGCGYLLWDHPDNEQHVMEAILHDRGCLTIFPPSIQKDEGFFWNTGLFLLMLMIFLIFLSALILILTQMGFDRNTGINNADFLFVPAKPPILHACRSAKIHPEDCCAFASERDDFGCDARKTKSSKEKSQFREC